MTPPAGWAARLSAAFLLGACAAMAAPTQAVAQKKSAPPPPAASSAAVPAATARTIAIAEDQRRFPDAARATLRDENPAVRARAALAIGRIQDTTHAALLLPLFRDPAVEVRREAVFALGQISLGNPGWPRRRSAQAESLIARLRDSDDQVVELALEALGKLGDLSATRAVVGFLADPMPPRRGVAAMALWRLADSTALEPLIARHTDPDPEVRWRVLYALEKIVKPSRVVLAVATHLEDSEWLVRAYAARTLGRQKSPRGVAYLLQALGDADAAVTVNAIRALQLIADTTCARCGSQIAPLVANPNPYVRASAATALGDRFAFAAADTAGRGLQFRALTAGLADSDPATRGACARSLIASRGAEAMAAVEPLLSDSSIYVRVAVLSALGTLTGRPEAARRIEARLSPNAPLFERMTAAEALAALRPSGAAAKLRAGLRDTSVLFVASCASALAEMKDSSSVRTLAEVYARRASDADADARIALRDALRELAGRRFADSLERAHPAPDTKSTDYAPDFADPPATRGAVLHTSRGDIEWAFFGADAPQTVKNFVRLARRGYFDGLAFHRVVPNFVIQDGDPTGTGSGGPGYSIRCEYNRLHYTPGMVGMALSGKDTGGSQWFITHSPQLHLNGRYTIFARVVRGMEVVYGIVQGDRVLKVDLLE